ncbi:MAG: IS3 family transposase [Bacteroidia bacterium]|nr:IS3 family transposase [Bacteroidia bacterium]
MEQCEPNRVTGLCCSLLGYSRQAYYQFQKQQEKEAFQSELIVQEVLKHRKLQKRIGGRKLFGMMNSFLHQHAIGMGRDAFFDVLRAYGLLVRIRKRKAKTTDSNHPYRKYPNLIKEFIPIAPNQLWVCDITYIVMGDGFGYLSLITDAYSRKIVGFCLHKTLSAQGTIAALKQALKNNPNTKGLIHHSDRGVQYCCHEYVEILQSKHIKISMTENGDPLENAIAERVNGILKTELLKERFHSFAEAQEAIAIAISTYNHLRPHNSIGNLTPFEAHSLNRSVLPKRLWKNYYQPKQKEVVMAED